MITPDLEASSFSISLSWNESQTEHEANLSCFQYDPSSKITTCHTVIMQPVVFDCQIYINKNIFPDLHTRSFSQLSLVIPLPKNKVYLNVFNSF